MKKFFLIISLILLFPSVAVATERIDHFHLSYTINQDTSLTVSENIDYYTSAAKHGIFRYLPETYTNRSHTPISVANVTISNGQTHPYTVSSSGSRKLIKIGDANRTFQGQRQYQLTYQVKYALTQISSGAELYWDLVGEDWEFPVNDVQATIHSPFAPIATVNCWSGQFGGNDNLCQAQVVDSHTVTVNYPRPLTQGNNVTVSVKLTDANQLVWPSWWQKNILTVGIIITLVVILSLMLIVGRDRIFVDDQQLTLTPTGPTKVRPLFYRLPKAFWYEPFPNLTPAQAGLIFTNPYGTLSSKLLVAEIIYLVEKGYLKIEFGEKTFLGGQDYIFTRLKAPPDDLPEFQKLILYGIYTTGSSVTLSKMKKKFFEHIPEIQAALKQSVRETQLYKPNKLLIRPSHKLFHDISMSSSLIVLAIIPLILPLILSLILSLILQFINPSPNFLVILWLIPFFLFGGAMCRRHYQLTALGNHYRYLINGLKQNLKLGKWRTEIQEKLLYVEKILPFAIALGVADKLARDMKELGLDHSSHDLSTSTLIGASLLSSGFIDTFSHDFSSVYSSQTSSGSGGSSGGGSSGGGGGGGGGGSW